MTGRITTDLVNLAEAELNRALVNLKAEQDRRRAIAGRIAALNVDLERFTRVALDGESQGGGQRHAIWLAWHADMVAGLHTELAAARVDGESSLREARRAFGRKAALDRLARTR